MEGALRLLARVEFAAIVFALSAGLLVYPYKNFHGDAAMLAAAGLCIGVLLAVFCIALRKRYDTLQWRIGIVPLVLAGIVLRLIVGIVASPEPVSDGLRNILLAEQLAQGGTYIDLEGRYAFFPPGYPLFLAPFLWLFGKSAATLITANLVLYLIGTFSLYALGRRMFDERVAMIAALLFTLWPGHALLVGIAAKENLAVAAVLLAMYCVHAALDRKRSLALGVAAGIALGAATLCQPGLSLLGLVCMIGFREELWPVDRRKLVVVALIAAGFAATVAPWMIRNHIVFEGRFAGIATNGGSVLYRANNPLATGLFIEQGERTLAPYDEVTANRLGREWALEWIKSRPLDALRLSLKKFVQFLTNDSHAAYWALYRTQGTDHAAEKARMQADPASLYIYRAGAFASNFFWLAMLACILLGLFKARHQTALCTPLIYPFLYLLAVHTVFESGSRHHMAPFALLLLIAAYYWAAAEQPSRVPAAFSAGPGLRAS